MDENNIVDELEQEIELENNEDDTTVSSLTEDDFYNEKTRREKAEKLLVELKKQNKELKAKIPQGEYVTKTELELNKLIDKEPELSEYTEDILSYTKKGLSIKEAALLVKSSDKAIENRKKIEQMNISGGEGNSTKTTYTLKELEDMPQYQYNQISDKIKSGEYKLIS